MLPQDINPIIFLKFFQSLTEYMRFKELVFGFNARFQSKFPRLYTANDRSCSSPMAAMERMENDLPIKILGRRTFPIISLRSKDEKHKELEVKVKSEIESQRCDWSRFVKSMLASNTDARLCGRRGGLSSPSVSARIESMDNDMIKDSRFHLPHQSFLVGLYDRMKRTWRRGHLGDNLLRELSRESRMSSVRASCFLNIQLTLLLFSRP